MRLSHGGLASFLCCVVIRAQLCTAEKVVQVAENVLEREGWREAITCFCVNS